MKAPWLLIVWNLLFFSYPFYHDYVLQIETSWQEEVLKNAGWLIVFWVLTNLLLVFATLVLKKYAR